jgi:hypothetical protein
VGVSSLTRIGKDDQGLMDQPVTPCYKGALDQI